MNKKLASELAIGITLLAAIMVGVIFWLQTPKAQAPAPQVGNEKTILAQQQASNQKTNNIADFEQAKVDAEWKLASGDPKDTCSNPQFDGQMKVHGWYVLRENYGAKEWMLVLTREDQLKLPMQPRFGDGRNANAFLKLTGAGTEIETKLKKATAQNPAEITLATYEIFCEGYPVVGLSHADEIANWQTYANTKLGFEIKHPASWQIKEYFGKSDFNVGGNDSYITFKNKNEDFLVLGIGNAKTDYLGQPTGLGAFDKQIPIGVIMVGGEKLPKYFEYYKSPTVGAQVWYGSYQLPQGHPYELRLGNYDAFIIANIGQKLNKKYNPDSLASDQELLEIDTILSTFKFTN